jgi:hypothetical protein
VTQTGDANRRQFAQQETQTASGLPKVALRNEARFVNDSVSADLSIRPISDRSKIRGGRGAA